jgi:hypothetical protein
VPSFAFPESAAIALGKAVNYAEWRSRPPSEPVPPADLERDRAAAIVARALGGGGGWLDPETLADRFR